MPHWINTLAARLDPAPAGDVSRERYMANPARAGLLAGGAMGVVNALLVALALELIAPETGVISFYIMMLAMALFIGGFLGGLVGLLCQWRGWSRGHLRLMLATGNLVFVLFLLLVVLVQFTK